MSSKIILLCGLLLCACTYTYAQEGAAQNPFELKERIEEAEKQDTTNSQPTTHNPQLENSQPTNPFEINNRPKEQETPTAQQHNNTTTQQHNNTPPKRLSHIWMGGIILILSILMAILNTLHRQDLQKTFRAFSNPNMMNLIYRSQKVSMTTMYLLTYILYVASAGLFLYLLGRYFEYSTIQSSIISVLVCMGFVAGITLGKHLLLQIIGWIMPFSKELKLYNYMISVFNHIIGIILLPLIIIAVFAPHPVGQWALLAGLGLVLLIYLYRAFRGLIIGGGFISFHKFHFFLYLCAVEVAPLLILIKLLKFWG